MKNAHFLVIGFLLGVVVVLAGLLVWKESGVPAYAQVGGTGPGEAGSITAVTGAKDNSSAVLWVIDSQKRKLAVYESNMGKEIKLIAVRDMSHDMRAIDYTNTSNKGPAVKEMKKWADEAEKKEREGGN
jgi:hypothetical protein